MRIDCPNCKLSGQISDIIIAPEGQYMDCPRCKSNFFVQKGAPSSTADTLSDCPECGYSTFTEERFDICPQCGLVAKTHNKLFKKPQRRRKEVVQDYEPVTVDKERVRQDLERLRLEEENKRNRFAGQELILPPVEQQPEALIVPDQVRYLGWAFIAVGALVVVSGCRGFIDYRNFTPEEIYSLLPEQRPGSLKLFFVHGLLPTLRLLLGIFMAAAGSQFLKMRTWAITGMESAAWSGIGYVVLSEAYELADWIHRSSSSGSFAYFFLGIIDTLFMLALWSAPLLAAIWYLRRESFVEAFAANSPANVN
jgi:transposase-like protein